MDKILGYFLETRDKDPASIRRDAVKFFITDGFLYDSLAALVVILINSLVPLVKISPVQRVYDKDDPDIGYPYVSSTISGTQLSILMLVIPIGTFFIALFIHKSLVDFHHSMLTLFESFALVVGFKRWMNLVGRYRPSYVALVQLGISGDEGGNESYPSGHAAYMFCGMTVTTLYLLGKFKVFAKPFPGLFAVAVVFLAPIMLSTFVAVTRPANYKHHFSDINAGMFIGLSLSIFCYFLNYPSLLDPDSGIPKLRSSVPSKVLTPSRPADIPAVHQTNDFGYSAAHLDHALPPAAAGGGLPA